MHPRATKEFQRRDWSRWLTDDAAVMDVVGSPGGLRETMPEGGIGRVHFAGAAIDTGRGTHRSTLLLRRLSKPQWWLPTGRRPSRPARSPKSRWDTVLIASAISRTRFWNSGRMRLSKSTRCAFDEPKFVSNAARADSTALSTSPLLPRVTSVLLCPCFRHRGCR
jgi:hypothetical protein